MLVSSIEYWRALTYDSPLTNLKDIKKGDIIFVGDSRYNVLNSPTKVIIIECDICKEPAAINYINYLKSKHPEKSTCGGYNTWCDTLASQGLRRCSKCGDQKEIKYFVENKTICKNCYNSLAAVIRYNKSTEGKEHNNIRALLSSVRRPLLCDNPRDRHKFAYNNLFKKTHTYEYFVETIKGKFQPGMSWNNYGRYIKDTFHYTWEIGHSMPVWAYGYYRSIKDKNFYEAEDPSNLFPEWAEENRKKKRGIIGLKDEGISIYDLDLEFAYM